MDKHELEEMTKEDLVNYADDHDIEVHQHWLKDEIIKEILKAEKKAAKEEAKQEQTQEQTTEAPAKQQVDPDTGVSPELAELQRQANQPVDDSTRFAANKPAEAKEDE